MLLKSILLFINESTELLETTKTFEQADGQKNADQCPCLEEGCAATCFLLIWRWFVCRLISF